MNLKCSLSMKKEFHQIVHLKLSSYVVRERRQFLIKSRNFYLEFDVLIQQLCCDFEL